MSLVRNLGRILFCAIFVLGGAMKIQGFVNETEEFEGMVRFASKGFADLGSQAVVDLVDGHVRELVLAAGVMELLGGLAIVFGGEACGAAMLLAALLPITVVLHNPLVDGSPAAMAHTLKNSSIIGALLMLLVGSSTPPLRRGKAKRD